MNAESKNTLSRAIRTAARFAERITDVTRGYTTEEQTAMLPCLATAYRDATDTVVRLLQSDPYYHSVDHLAVTGDLLDRLDTIEKDFDEA